jgi:hypothetical protein
MGVYLHKEYVGQRGLAVELSLLCLSMAPCFHKADAVIPSSRTPPALSVQLLLMAM